MSKPSANPPDNRQVDQLLSRLETLPTLPAVAIELLNLTASRKSSALEVIRLIETDQALTARILRLARATAMHRVKVQTVRQAVLDLGFLAVRNAVLAIKVYDIFERAGGETRAAGFDRQAFWQHCLAVGCAGFLLAKQTGGKVDPEDAFVAGLLHDLGKLALDAVAPEAFHQVVEKSRQERRSLLEVELAAFGTDHCGVGRHLACRWGLPEGLTSVIASHHTAAAPAPDGGGPLPLVELIQAADALARHQRIGDSGNCGPLAAPDRMAERVGLGRKEFERVLRDFGAEIESRAAVIGLNESEVGQLYRNALERANDELARVNQQLIRSTRRLELRSRLFRALATLTYKVTPEMSTGRIAQIMAETACLGLSAQQAICVAVPSDEDQATVAHWSGQQSGSFMTELAAIDWFAQRLRNTSPVLVPMNWTSGSLAPPRSEEPAASLLAEFVNRAESDPAWMLPIVHGQRGLGAILLTGPQHLMQTWQTQAGDIEALSATLGLTLGWTAAKRSAELLAEDLAQKNRALIETHQELLQTQSLRQLAEMAEGAAHELNNPLTNISARADLLAAKIEDSTLRDTLDVIGQQAQEASGIVAALREFAQPRRPDFQPINVVAALRETAEKIADKHGASTEQLSIQVQGPLPRITADHDQFVGAIHEVLDNSLHACQGRLAEIMIQAELLGGGDHVRVTISDNGCGMTPDVLSKATSPFFSHQAAGRRPGLGLSRASRWIQQHGGALRISSEPDKGTTVQIDWPVAIDPGLRNEAAVAAWPNFGPSRATQPDLRLVFPED